MLLPTQKEGMGCIRCPGGCNFFYRNKPPFSRFVLCACAARASACVCATDNCIPIMSCDYASAT